MFGYESFGQDLPENWSEIAAYLNSIAESMGIDESNENEADNRDMLDSIWEKYWSAYHAGELPENAPKPIA